MVKIFLIYFRATRFVFQLISLGFPHFIALILKLDFNLLYNTCLFVFKNFKLFMYIICKFYLFLSFAIVILIYNSNWPHL